MSNTELAIIEAHFNIEEGISEVGVVADLCREVGVSALAKTLEVAVAKIRAGHLVLQEELEAHNQNKKGE